MKTAIRIFGGAVLALATAASLAQSVPSRNDTSAVYVDGTFTLPESLSAKQYYVIVIQQQGAKDVEVRLPQGANLTRLVPAARPAGAFTWSYRLRPIEGAAVTVVSPTDARVALGQLTTVATDKRFLTLEWRHLPEAVKYRIMTQDVTKRADGTEKVGSDNAPINVDSLDDLRDAIAPAKLETIPFPIPVTPGQRFQWRVEAQDDKGHVVAISKPMRVDIDDPWYAKAGKAGFSLQRSETLAIRELRKTDALISFAQTSSEAKANAPATQDVRSFSSEFALLWRGPQNLVTSGADVLIPTGSLEARLNSSGAAKANDVVRGRLGLGWTSNKPPFDSVANVKWEHDRKTRMEKNMLELAVTPLFDLVGVLLPRYDSSRRDVYGNVIPGKQYPIQFGFTPTLGIDYGKTRKQGEGSIERDDVFRYFGTLKIDVEVPLLASMLQIPRVSGWADLTTRYLKDEPSGRRKDFVSSSIEFWLAPNVALAATYKVGRDAPAFEWGRSFGLGLTGRFN